MEDGRGTVMCHVVGGLIGYHRVMRSWVMGVVMYCVTLVGDGMDTVMCHVSVGWKGYYTAPDWCKPEWVL